MARWSGVIGGCVMLFWVSAGQALAQEGPALVSVDETIAWCGQQGYPGAWMVGSPDDVEAVSQQFILHAYSFTVRARCGQMMAAVALDLKEQAIALQETAKALGAGSTNLENKKKLLDDSNKIKSPTITQADIASRELKSESRGPLIAAIIYAAITVKNGVEFAKASKQYVGFTADVIKNAGMLQRARMAASLKGTIDFAKDAPGAVNSAVSTLRTLVDYARARDVAVPDDAAASLSLFSGGGN